MATSPHQTMNQEIPCLVFFQNLGDVQPSETWDSFQETYHEFWVTNLVALSLDRNPRPTKLIQITQEPGSFKAGCGHFQTHQAFRKMSMVEASVAAFSCSLDVNADSIALTIIAILRMLVPRYPKTKLWL